MSKRKAPTKRKNWKKIATSLAGRVLFCLQYAKHLSKGSGTIMRTDPVTGKREFVRWEDTLMDALDEYGYVLNRKAYFADKSTGKRRARS